MMTVIGFIEGQFALRYPRFQWWNDSHDPTGVARRRRNHRHSLNIEESEGENFYPGYYSGDHCECHPVGTGLGISFSDYGHFFFEKRYEGHVSQIPSVTFWCTGIFCQDRKQKFFFCKKCSSKIDNNRENNRYSKQTIDHFYDCKPLLLEDF